MTQTVPIPQLNGNNARNAISRSPQSKLTVTHIAGSTPDAMKKTYVTNFAKFLDAKIKKSDCLVIIVQDPQL